MEAAAIQSAETMAALRALAGSDRSLATPCSDAFARVFLSPRNKFLVDRVPSRLSRALLNVMAPGSYAFAVARTRHFDETLLAALRNGIEQVVILGAGYDCRGLRFADALKSAVIYELDHPGTQARKIQRLAAAACVVPSNVKFVSIDFAKQSLDAALAANGFDKFRRTIFLWEGVSYYLPSPAVEAVLRFVGNCAAGSTIAFDYALASFVAGDTSTYGGTAIARWLEKIGEPFLFGLEPSAAPTFLLRQGLRVVTHIGPEELERRYLQTTDGRPASRTLGHLRLIEAQSITGAMQ
jgi:methyltransferase (TIGR00027 family)